MNIGKAITILIEKYNIAKDNPQINKPIAWALYRTWRTVDEKERKHARM